MNYVVQMYMPETTSRQTDIQTGRDTGIYTGNQADIWQDREQNRQKTCKKRESSTKISKRTPQATVVQ